MPTQPHCGVRGKVSGNGRTGLNPTSEEDGAFSMVTGPGGKGTSLPSVKRVWAPGWEKATTITAAVLSVRDYILVEERSPIPHRRGGGGGGGFLTCGKRKWCSGADGR